GCEPPGAVPRGDAVVQSCSRCVARRCGKGDSNCGTRDRIACQYSRKLPRDSSGISIFAVERVVVDSCGARHGLHRAGSVVRKLHSITILSTLPSAGLGALLALSITKVDFSIIALIGIILLIGIVQKNAIMMIDFALDAQRNERKRPIEAIYQACLLRFRPIMMTTMAAMLGGVPLALGTGVGSELRHPLGITIVGGLAVSQLLTLYTVP